MKFGGLFPDTEALKTFYYQFCNNALHSVMSIILLFLYDVFYIMFNITASY